MHEAFFAAGADVATTNSFVATPHHAGGEERLVDRSDALLRARTNQKILTTGLEPAIFALGGRRLVH